MSEGFVFSEEELERRNADVEVNEAIERDRVERIRAGRRLREIEEQERQDLLENPSEYARRELARRELCRNRLLPFVMRFSPDYDPGWVHKDICRRLEKFSADVANRLSPRMLITMPPRHGKEIAHETPVLTLDGWKTHGELEAGDRVFHPSGQATEVVAVSPETGADDHLVEFTDGESVLAHANHDWVVWDRAQRKHITVETSWFLGTTRLGEPRKLWTGTRGKRGGRARYQLPPVDMLQMPAQDLTVDPYMIGVWLGDGSCNGALITNSEEDAAVFQRALAAVGYEHSKVYVHTTYGTHRTYFGGTGLSTQLKALGVYHEKAIPAQYLRSSASQRLELLAGLIDTDGHVDPQGRYRYVTVSEELRDGVMDLCTTLGFRPYLMMQEATTSSSGIEGRSDVYTVGFQPTVELPCRIARKQTKRLAPQRRRSISAVRCVSPKPGRCIQVDADDGLYLVGRTLIPTHNSELTSKKFPAWHLGRYPKHEIMACSYSGALSMSFSRVNREILRDPAYHQLFDTRLSTDSQGAEAWMTTEAGGYVSAGVGGSLTGRGASCLIIDDPTKNREEAESETNRKNTWDWYTSTAYTRLAPGGGVLVILTRWQDDDLAGRLLVAMGEGADQWEHVDYPAIAKVDEKYRKKGQALHPARYDEVALARIEKAIGPRDWAALYQQDPVPEEGAYFNKENIVWYDYEDPMSLPPADTMVEYAAWDLAIGQKQENDFSVGGVVSVDQHSRLWVRDVWRGHWGAKDLCTKILDLHVKWRCNMYGIEKGMIEMSIGPFLEEMKKDRKLWDFYYHELKPGRQDKVARARAIQGMFESGKVHIPYNAPWTEDFVNELLRFPSGVNDDQVDFIAWIGMMLMIMAPATLIKKKKPSWKDKLVKFKINGASERTAMSS